MSGISTDLFVRTCDLVRLPEAVSDPRLSVLVPATAAPSSPRATVRRLDGEARAGGARGARRLAHEAASGGGAPPAEGTGPGSDGDATWGARVTDESWLERFWRAEKATMDEVCRNLLPVVDGATARYLHGADRDTVVQSVFLKVLADEKVRRNFTGGSLRAWIGTVARNQAIDFARRRNREVPSDPTDAEAWTGAAENLHAKAEARMTIQRFREERLPEKWAPVFEARFLEQLSQREAAAELGISRTTLAYQEARVRHLLRRFLLQPGGRS